MSSSRDRLVLALDLDDLGEARALAARLAPWFATVKVGFELYAVAGPAAFDALHADGFRIFADLKLHDIPTTVARAARVHGRRGVELLNFHAAGGATMLRAGAEAYREGADEAGFASPGALGVTVLTSEPEMSAFASRLASCSDAGLDGVVCAAAEVESAHAARLRAMVPGIRRVGDSADDQARVATPGDAIRRGADWLVIARTVTSANDPERTAAELTAEVDAALGRA